MFSISIDIPHYIDLDKRPRPIIVKFNTKEEKESYLAGEYKATINELKGLAKAWTKYERTHAYEKLYHARNAYKNFVQKPPETKESA